MDEKGEFIQTDSKSIFEPEYFPSRITTVLFENSTYYRSRVNNEPRCKFVISFDTRKSQLFDFNVKPSNATPNNSQIDISGNSFNWVEGTYQNVINLINENRSYSSWLHRNNIYDLALWFAAFPLAFWYLFKLNAAFNTYLIQWNTISVVAFHFYLFGVFLYLFRIIFDYTRWVYPYLEIRSKVANIPMIHRTIHASIFLGLLGDIIKNIIFR